MEFKAIVFLPLLGALIAGFLGRWITDRGAEPHRETPADGTTLIDASGAEWAAGTREVVGPGFGSATIGPGASRTGWVTFEVPALARPILLRFVADGGFGGAAEWRLP